MCFWNVAVGINLRKRTEKTEYLPWIGCPWWGWKRRVKKLPWNSTLKTKIMASSPSVKSESVSCSVTSDSLDCGSPGSSVHGILQARILEWVAILFSRGSTWPRDRILYSSAWQADSLLSEPLGKPIATRNLYTKWTSVLVLHCFLGNNFGKMILGTNQGVRSVK